MAGPRQLEDERGSWLEALRREQRGQFVRQAMLWGCWPQRKEQKHRDAKLEKQQGCRWEFGEEKEQEIRRVFVAG